MVCLEVQKRLHEAEWPPALRYWKDGEGNEDAGLWGGLRVRMGLHHCTDVEPKYDTIHKGYDYYGNDVNLASRVQSVAAGGQVAMSAATYEQLQREADYNDLVADDAAVRRVSDGVELKGVDGKVALVSLASLAFQRREFPAIDGYADEDSTAMPNSGTDDHTLTDTMSESAASSQGNAASRLVLEEAFAAVGNPKQRQAFLDAACAAHNVRRAPFAMRVKMLHRAIDRKQQLAAQPNGLASLAARATPRQTPRKTPRKTPTAVSAAKRRTSDGDLPGVPDEADEHPADSPLQV